MKIIKLIVSSLLLVVSVLALNPIGTSAEWKKDSNGWWNTEGSSWSVGWKEIDGKWYYFGQDGYMVHDTTINGYIIGSDGARIKSTQNNLSNSYSIFNPTKQSIEELYQDIFVSLLLPDIQKSVDDYYKNFLTEPPIVAPYYVHVLNADRLMGYRSFSFRLKLEVDSYIGPHLNIGDDYITLKIEGGDKVTIEKFEHIKSYYLDLPSNYQNIIIKKSN
ncbi:cell wall binding repeat-containing protein [Clostridium sp. DL-VIII]|uniref:DUF3888 domain-containing protein n=1 Tax=Clostridium sp. DL-VIII TaxID=641107 RepID=UPI00023B007F|nr:cell wall binding repeat-containing protein [Clostridium sp. DL-VIII]